jgi:hypothetical protein
LFDFLKFLVEAYACDHNGQQLAYVYFEDEPRRRSAASDEARRMYARFMPQKNTDARRMRERPPHHAMAEW